MKTKLAAALAVLLAVAASAADVPKFFTLPREKPWRLVDGIPSNATPGGATFEGAARPGEFYVFQVGIVAGDAAIKLQGTAYPVSPDCITLDGAGSDGNLLVKTVTVPPHGVQVLWYGMDVPRDTHAPLHGGIALAGGTVGWTVNITGAAVDDHGDSIAKNLSRLRWLDSTSGGGATVTKPLSPVVIAARSVEVLGRKLVLADDGLPEQVFSYFNAANTKVTTNGMSLLARPLDFSVEMDAGTVLWRRQFGTITSSSLRARWTAHETSGELDADMDGTLDYTGSGELHVALHALRDVAIKDIRLDAPWSEDAAKYFMGLNRQGGKRPADGVKWKWDVRKHQDCFWMGDVNCGMMMRFKADHYVRPLVNIYYKFKPLNLPKSWDNDGKGGIDILPAKDGVVMARVYSGPRTMKKGDSLYFNFDFYLTPFRTIDTEKQWATRFVHPHPSRDPKLFDQVLAECDPVHGPNVINIHQATYYEPYINYPYSDESFPALKEFIKRAHAKGIKVRPYYTTREITQNMPEFFALASMNGEIIFPGPGAGARTVINPHGPNKWLVDNLGTNFIPAWVDRVGGKYAAMDLSVITQPDSRWNNFYLAGLKYMCDNADIDGMYIDDSALDAQSLQRARRILDTRPGRLIDLHSWNHFNNLAGWANNLNIYMEILPYLDRLWLGEGFNCNTTPPDQWLVTMSGLPFGLMSEMLDGANPWRGLVFGETARLGWSGDPRPIWKAWDEYGIQGAEFIPYFVANNPVKTGRDDILATVYRKKGRSLVAIASWAKKPEDVKLAIDWKALGLDPAKAQLYAPQIAGFQTESQWKPGDAIPVAPGRGWFLVLDETPRTVSAVHDTAASLVELWRDVFTAPVLGEGWRVVKTGKASCDVGPHESAFRIKAPANVFAGIERALPKNVRAVEAELDAGTDAGQTWGPGVALVWANGHAAKINLRTGDKQFGTFAGDGLRHTGGPVSFATPVTVRILLDGAHVIFQTRAGEAWRTVDTQSRAGLEGGPVALRLGKLAGDGSWSDSAGGQGAAGESAYKNVRVLGE